MSAGHAKFSPSAAHRWLNCPGSIRLSDGIPSRSSWYADEGTAAHRLAAECLVQDLDPIDAIGSAIAVNGADFAVTAEMAGGVAQFVGLVRSLVAEGYSAEIEVRLDLGALHPDTWGTGDAVLFHPETRHLCLLDFKYGAGVAVEAFENPQLLTYGSGAARLVGGAAVLTLAIVQPRTPAPPAVKTWDVPAGRLARFEDEFRAACAAASRPDAALRAGDWCKFCPAANACPAKAAAAVDLGPAWGEPPRFWQES